MKVIPSNAPSSINPLMRKMNSTTYGKTVEKYITYDLERKKVHFFNILGK